MPDHSLLLLADILLGVIAVLLFALLWTVALIYTRWTDSRG
jgi:hypothetical protein